jgi:hypothetical protein
MSPPRNRKTQCSVRRRRLCYTVYAATLHNRRWLSATATGGRAEQRWLAFPSSVTCCNTKARAIAWPQPLNPRYQPDRRLDGPRAAMDEVEEKDLASVRTRTPTLQPSNPQSVTLPTDLLRPPPYLATSYNVHHWLTCSVPILTDCFLWFSSPSYFHLHLGLTRDVFPWGLQSAPAKSNTFQPPWYTYRVLIQNLTLVPFSPYFLSANTFTWSFTLWHPLINPVGDYQISEKSCCLHLVAGRWGFLLNTGEHPRCSTESWPTRPPFRTPFPPIAHSFEIPLPFLTDL